MVFIVLAASCENPATSHLVMPDTELYPTPFIVDKFDIR